jgi:uncharacterized protein
LEFLDKPVPEYIVRPEYQALIDSYCKSGEIIILKGVRRSGKSTLLINHIRQLVNHGVRTKEVLFVNFEDPRFTDKLDANFLEKILEVYKEFINPETKPHIFLEEVQNVLQWEKWVHTGSTIS